MTKLVVVLALAGTIQGQPQPQAATPNRPNYSGRWSLVEDRSAPAGRGLGKSIKIEQSATVLTIDSVAIAYGATIGANGLPTTPTPQSEMTTSTAYALDGVEHELPLRLPGRGPGNLPPDAQAAVPPTRTYRATWTTDQLIVFTVTHGVGGRGSSGAITSVGRLALSLDADGSLIVDSLTVPMMPRMDGPKQEPPVSLRSVYKRAQ